MQHISQPRQDSPPLQLHLPFDYTDDNALRKNQHPQKLSNPLSFTSRRSFQSQQLPYPSTADIFAPTSYPPFEYTAKPPIDPYYHQLKGQQQQQQFQQQSQHQQPQPQQQQASYPSFPPSGLHIQSQTPYGPHLQTPAPSINPSSGVIPPPSANTGANMNGSAAQGQQPEEISTIFVVGFPDDMQEREFQNMFTFSQGFEAATLKIPNKEYTAYGGGTGAGASSTPSARAGYPYGANDPYNLVTVNQGGVVVDGGRDGTTASWPAATTAFDEPLLVPPRKQIIGFAKFRSRGEALEARDTLQGRRVDVEKGAVLKAEMAKKNLHTKRGVGGSVSVGVGMGMGGGVGSVSGIGGMGGLGMMNGGNVIGLGGGPGAAGAGATGTAQFSSVLGNNNVNGNGTFSPGTIGVPEGLGGGAEAFAAREKQLGALGAMGFGLDFNVGSGSSSSGVNGWRNDWVEEDKEREKEKERRAGAISAMGLGLGSGSGNAFGAFGTTRGPRERAEDEDRRRREWEKEREEGESVGGQMKSEEEREIEEERERDRARDTARPQAFTSNNHLHTFGPASATVFNHSNTGLSLTSNQSQRESLRSANISAFDAFHSVPAGLVGPTGNNSINNINNSKSNGDAPSDDPWTYDLGRRMSSLQVSSPPSVSFSGSGSEADTEQKQCQGQGQTFSPTLSDAHAHVHVKAFGLAPSRGSLSNPPSSASSAAGDGAFGLGFGAGKATANVGVGTGTSAGVGSGVEREEQLALTISNGTTSPQLPSPASGGSTSAGTSASGRGAVDQNPPINTLYVGNLPTAHTSPGAGPLEDALRALFQRSPGFRKLCFRQKANGPMCFVEFEDVAYAAQAMRDLGGNMLNGLVKGGIRLSYSKNPLGIRTPIGQQQPQQNSQQGLQNGGQLIGAAEFDVVRTGGTRQEGGNSYGFMASPPPPRFFSPSPSSSSSMFVTNGIPTTQYPRTQQHAYGNDIASSTSSAFSSAFSPSAFSPYTPASSTFSPFGLSTPPPHQQKQSQIVPSSGAIPEHHQHHQAEAARAA